MRVKPATAAEEYVDPRRTEFPSLDLCLVRHEDFTGRSNGQLEHSGTAVSTWNRSFRAGFCRSIQGAPWIDHLTPAIKLYHNPNVVLVPEAEGCSELHAMMASLLPDGWLRKRKIPRPVANFELWPFSAEWKGLDRTRIARQVEQAFQQFIWKRVARKHDSLRVLKPGSSTHVVFADPKHWMHALYGLAIRRAEEHCSDQEPINEGARMRDGLVMSGDEHFGTKTINLGNGDFLIENERGERSKLHVPDFTANPLGMCYSHPKTQAPMIYPGLRKYPTSPATLLWDPHDEDSRESVLHELVKRDSLGQSVEVLLAQAEPEDYKSGLSSHLRIEAERRFKGRSKKISVDFIDCSNGSAVYDGHAHDGEQTLIEGREIFRGAMALLDSKQRRAVVMLMHGTTLNDIAEQLGYADHTGAKRLIDRIFDELRTWLT